LLYDPQFAIDNGVTRSTGRRAKPDCCSVSALNACSGHSPQPRTEIPLRFLPRQPRYLHIVRTTTRGTFYLTNRQTVATDGHKKSSMTAELPRRPLQPRHRTYTPKQLPMSTNMNVCDIICSIFGIPGWLHANGSASRLFASESEKGLLVQDKEHPNQFQADRTAEIIECPVFFWGSRVPRRRCP
jgi:hypothetical protein